jgi:hypothetical protein
MICGVAWNVATREVRPIPRIRDRPSHRTTAISTRRRMSAPANLQPAKELTNEYPSRNHRVFGSIL